MRFLGVLVVAILFATPAQAVFKAVNNVKETTATTGTGTINLAGPATGYSNFDSQLATADTTLCSIYNDTDGFEIDICTFTDSAPDTLARTTLIWSSTGSALNLTVPSEVTSAVPAEWFTALLQADYLVGTANATLTGELVVGTTATDGHVLRRAGGAYGWGALDLADTDAVTGDLADANLTANVSLLGQTIESSEIAANTVAAADIAADTVTRTELADSVQGYTRCMTIESPVDADNLIFFRVESAITITGIDCLVNAATYAVMTMQQCDANAANCTTTEAAMNCTTSNVTEASTIDDATMAAGTWARIDVGAVSGTPGQLAVCLTATVDD